MSDDRRKRNASEKQRMRLPDGTWGFYMGETGGQQKRTPSHSAPQRAVSDTNDAGKHKLFPSLSLNAKERLEAEERKKSIRARRAAATAENRKKIAERAPENKKFYHVILDRLNMWRLGISVNLDSLVKALIIGALIIVFSMLQITVFSKLRPFGATPDLMLPLVVAIGITEGERWGGVSGLAAAFIIECLGSAGITLLPLLYVPCGFIAGVLGTYYMRDSLALRALFTALSGLLRSAVTLIYVYVSFNSPSFSEVIGKVIAPEYLSTVVFAVLPHVAAWLAMKPYHKTRAERVE
ncbi:MAG: hypothetical protein IJS45_02780 [Clostridia bacterium]|nr:hypothetical protein [Clostridia bacterium]